MDLFLDNKTFESDRTTLGGLIDDALELIAGSGRIIVEVRLDGQAISTEEIEKQQEDELTVQEVQLITADPCFLASETLLDARDLLTEAREMQQAAATLLQADQPQEALEPLREVLSIWQQTQQAVLLSSQLLELNLDEMNVDGTPASKTVNDLVGLLHDLREQLINNDWIGLADTLAYPLNDAADAWEKMINWLCEVIKPKPEA